MVSLDVSNRNKWFLNYKINRLVKRYSEIPSKLIITMEQYEHLHKHIEVFCGNDRIPTEFIFYGKLNAMEVEIKGYAQVK